MHLSIFSSLIDIEMIIDTVSLFFYCRLKFAYLTPLHLTGGQEAVTGATLEKIWVR